jgi:DNA-directed RNA polymerase specialized sigma subunit
MCLWLLVFNVIITFQIRYNTQGVNGVIDKKQIAVNFIEQAKHSLEIKRMKVAEIATWEGLLSSFLEARSHRVSSLDGTLAKNQGIIKGIQADKTQEEPRRQAEKQLFDRLPENMATLLRMRYPVGYQHKEIKDALNLDRNRYFVLHREALMFVYDHMMIVSDSSV